MAARWVCFAPGAVTGFGLRAVPASSGPRCVCFVPGAVQSEEVLLAIRGLTALGPGIFLALAIAFAWSYPLGRERHGEILEELARRRATASRAARAAEPIARR